MRIGVVAGCGKLSRWYRARSRASADCFADWAPILASFAGMTARKLSESALRARSASLTCLSHKILFESNGLAASSQVFRLTSTLLL